MYFLLMPNIKEQEIIAWNYSSLNLKQSLDKFHFEKEWVQWSK